MRTALKIRWLFVGCIWLATLVLTYWNSIKIDDIASMRESNERLRKEMLFQRRNADELMQVGASHQALYMPVESLALGIVSIKSHLHSLSAAFDLAQVQVKNDITQATEEHIPLNFSARGSFDKAVAFLTVLQKYPYLPVIRTDIKVVNEQGDIEMTVALDFRYSIGPSPQTHTDPLQVYHRPPIHGAERI